MRMEARGDGCTRATGCVVAGLLQQEPPGCSGSNSPSVIGVHARPQRGRSGRAGARAIPPPRARSRAPASRGHSLHLRLAGHGRRHRLPKAKAQRRPGARHAKDAKRCREGRRSAGLGLVVNRQCRHSWPSPTAARPAAAAGNSNGAFSRSIPLAASPVNKLIPAGWRVRCRRSKPIHSTAITVSWVPSSIASRPWRAIGRSDSKIALVPRQLSRSPGRSCHSVSYTHLRAHET